MPSDDDQSLCCPSPYNTTMTTPPDTPQRWALWVIAVTHLLAIASNRAVADEPPVQIVTIFIEGGTFTMGTPIRNTWDSEYHRDERRLSVSVADFRIGKYPVTAEQMCAFLNSPEASQHRKQTLYNHRDLGAYTYSVIVLGDDGLYSPREGADKAPANQVTWKGAVLFCEWLSQRTGKTYRLPAEAEWELAARGPERRTWPWGENPPTKTHGPRYDPDEILNSADLAARMANNEPTWPTTPVGSHPKNATPEGVHDMLAYTIGEWRTNKYARRPTAKRMVSPTLDLEDLTTNRVVRGYYHRHHSGLLSWIGGLPHLGRSWTRVGCHPMNAVQHAARHGFRVVEEMESKPTANGGNAAAHSRSWLVLLLVSVLAILGLLGRYAWRKR